MKDDFKIGRETLTIVFGLALLPCYLYSIFGGSATGREFADGMVKIAVANFFVEGIITSVVRFRRFKKCREERKMELHLYRLDRQISGAGSRFFRTNRIVYVL